MSIDDLAKQLPEDCVWYLAKCHNGDMHGKHYAEMTVRNGGNVHMEFYYADTAEAAMSGLVNKVINAR